MFRLIAFFVAVLLPGSALALCEARDLINALPAQQYETLTDQAEAIPYARGLMWRATRDDTTITLFGTYHFKHEKTQAHLERLKPLIEKADAVYLEMSDAHQKGFEARIAKEPSLMFITQGPTLPELLGEEDWLQLKEEMRLRQIPGIVAAKFKPIWAGMMLGIGPCEAQNGAMSEAGIDSLVSAYAEDQGITTQSLEDFAELLTSLDTLPLDQQIEMIRLSLNHEGSADDLAFTIRDRYLREEIALAWEYTRLLSEQIGGPGADKDFALMEDLMLTRRNMQWVDILSTQSAARNIIVAVGAGHFPGQTGVLHLLEQEGFALERLPVLP